MRKFKVGDRVQVKEITKKELFFVNSLKSREIFTIKEILKVKDQYGNFLIVLDNDISISQCWIVFEKKFIRNEKFKRII